MAYGDFKDLTTRTSSYKMLHDKAVNIWKNAKYDGYQRVLASVFYKCSDKKKNLLCVQINLLIVVLRMKICQTSN